MQNIIVITPSEKGLLVINNNSIFIKKELSDVFFDNWNQCQIIFFSAPSGFGKTSVAKKLLSDKIICELNVQESEILLEDISQDAQVVFIDDIQEFVDEKKQKKLCQLMKARRDLHFVLLGRGNIPGWLMPFQFARSLFVIDDKMLSFDILTTQSMFESRGMKLTDNELSEIHRRAEGYPLAIDMFANKFKKGPRDIMVIHKQTKRDIYHFFKEDIYLRFSPALQQLLISLALFDNFDLGIAKMISEDPKVAQTLNFLERNTNILTFDGVHTYYFRPFLKEFLIWVMKQEFSLQQQNTIYRRGALYYELNGNLSKALRYYRLANEHEKVSEILVENSEQNPSIGHYRELKDYYYDLPQAEMAKSLPLMCGMSMLSSLYMDQAMSEYWYDEIKNYARKFKASEPEHQNAISKIAYLDIALPHRDTEKVIAAITKGCHQMNDAQIKMPRFSVTGNLPSIINGEKDFCAWSKQDDLLYTTMKKPVETLLGADGVGFIECAYCESCFEKGEFISKDLLNLMGNLSEIQIKGVADIEFAVIGLLARVNASEGKAELAIESLENLKQKFIKSNDLRFLDNIEAMICRLHNLLGNREQVRIWLQDKSPAIDTELWILWRYQYLTLIEIWISEGEYDQAMLLLARLLPYCGHCKRVMDCIYINLLEAICKKRTRDPSWRLTFAGVLDSCSEYKFVRPIAQYGVAVLPLLIQTNWTKDPAFLDQLISETRTQAILYPRFLKEKNQSIEPLSNAEIKVLKLLCANLSNQEIGEILGIKMPTVKTHVSRILNKLGVRRRNEVKDIVEELNLF